MTLVQEDILPLGHAVDDLLPLTCPTSSLSQCLLGRPTQGIGTCFAEVWMGTVYDSPGPAVYDKGKAPAHGLCNPALMGDTVSGDT